MKSEKKMGQFSRFTRRLTTEGLLKALLVALTIAFGVVFVVGTVTWFTETNALWLCVGLLAGIAMVGVPVIYHFFFRPTIQSHARRIDRLGFEERMVTMVELENDDSILSRLQREDAQKHLAEADEKQMKIMIPTAMVVSSSIAAVLGLLMATLSTLAALGIIMSGAELMDPLIPDPPVEYVYIEYIVEMGGTIEGEEFQEVIMGENGTEVVVIPEEGWVFAGWEDGGKRPERIEIGVKENMILVAILEPSGEGDGQPGDGEGEGEGEGKPGDQPGQGQGKGQDGDSENQNPSGAGGKYEAANQIIDGETYYLDVFEQYQDMVEEYLTSGEEIPEDIQEVIESYYEIIG